MSFSSKATIRTHGYTHQTGNNIERAIPFDFFDCFNIRHKCDRLKLSVACMASRSKEVGDSIGVWAFGKVQTYGAALALWPPIWSALEKHLLTYLLWCWDAAEDKIPDISAELSARKMVKNDLDYRI